MDQRTVLHVDRRASIGQKELLNDYVHKNRPVIITDTAKQWSAVGKWTPEFFEANYPEVTREVRGQVIRLADQIDKILVSTPENPAPYPYNLELEDHFPELMSDLSPQFVFGKMDRGASRLMPGSLMNGTPIHEVFFGGNGSTFPFVHYDALFLHTQITQIYGDKDLVLFHPDDGPYLYPRTDNEKFSQVRNVFDPDLENFPLFANARPYFETLHEGETIYFPCGWWHTTVTHGPSITYGRVVLNSLNYDRYLGDKYTRWLKNGRLKANVAYATGKVMGGIFSAIEAFK